MDPNANLEEQRRLAARMLASHMDDNYEDAYRLAELVQALDGWLCKRGHVPRDWDHSYDRAVYEAEQRAKDRK